MNEHLLFADVPGAGELQSEPVAYMVITKPFIQISGAGNVPFTMSVRYDISYVFNPLRSNTFAANIAPPLSRPT